MSRLPEKDINDLIEDDFEALAIEYYEFKFDHEDSDGYSLENRFMHWLTGSDKKIGEFDKEKPVFEGLFIEFLLGNNMEYERFRTWVIESRAGFFDISEIIEG